MSIEKVKKILFYGELYPNIIHGVSISNLTNLECLKDNYDIKIIEEKSDILYHSKFKFLKLKFFFGAILKFTSTNLYNQYSYFYTPLKISRSGLIINLILCVIFKAYNFNSKTIIHIHRSDLNQFLKNRINFILFNLLKLCVYRFIVLSIKQKNELHLSNVDNTVVLYNTVYEKNPVKFIKSSENTNIKISFISNFLKEKGIEELIHAIVELESLYENIELNCYGRFANTEFEQIIKSLVKKSNKISLNEPVIDKKKLIVFQNSDLVILPSYNEGVPIIMLECMKYGVPIMITNVGYINEFLGNNYQLYIKPKCTKSIINTFNLFIKMDKNYLANNLKKKYKKFRIHEHKKEILKIFNI